MGERDAYSDLLDRANRRLAERLFAGAVMLQAEAKRDYSRLSNPAPHLNPAPKGAWPAGRTWNLRDGIAINPDSPAGVLANGLRVRVGYLKGAFYGAALARRGWKGIFDTLDRVRDRLARLLAGR